MKTALLLSLGILTFGGAASAQEFKFDALRIEYGKVAKGSDGVRVFRYKNIGDAPLVVYAALSECRCLVAQLSDTRVPVAPGETGELAVKYDTTRVGPFTKSIEVRSNQRSGQNVTLTVAGEVLLPGSVPDPVK